MCKKSHTHFIQKYNQIIIIEENFKANMTYVAKYIRNFFLHILEEQDDSFEYVCVYSVYQSNIIYIFFGS